MASDYLPTPFLALPNELIYHIFKYLSAIDLVLSFGDLPNHRLQQLFGSYISLLNLKLTDAVTSLTWLNQYRAVVQKYAKRAVVDITFTDKLLSVIPKLDALTVIYYEDRKHFLDRFVVHYQTVTAVHIGALILSTYDGDVKTNTANILLGNNGHLPEHTLNMSDCLLQLDMHNLPSHSWLRNLNCMVQEEAFLYALLTRLPKLETSKIGLISHGLESESNIWENLIVLGISNGTESDSDSDDKKHIVYPRYKPKKNVAKTIVVASSHLRSISITGHIANFDLLSRLFQLASKSLKTIKLKVSAYSIVDPDQVNCVANHINFDFSVNYQLFQLPTDFEWKSYIDAFTHRPAIRCEDNVFRDLASVTHKSTFWLQTPKIFVTSPQVLCFPQVHTLKFQYCRFRIDINTVKLIRQGFSSMHRLVWRLPPPRVTSEILLDMEDTLVVHSEDRQTLQGLLLLCPNVTRLYFTRAFEQVEELPELNEKRVQNVCEQIKRVQLVPAEKVTEQSVKKLFPNTEVTYDAEPFYEKMF